MDKDSIRTYFHFNGNDAVTWLNGHIEGSIRKISKKLDGDLRGDFEFEMTRFEEVTLLPKDTLGVTVFLDENQNVSYEVFLLEELKSYEDEVNIATDASDYLIDKTVYKGRLITPMTRAPKAIKNVDDEAFKKLVKRVHGGSKNERWLPDKEWPNNLAARIYYWVLSDRLLLWWGK